MSTEQDGLVEKFIVQRVDPEAQARHRDCRTFVLEPRHDPHARFALAAYAASVKDELPQLHEDLVLWLLLLEDGDDS